MKMQTELPKDFVRLMHEHYDKQVADALVEALDTTEPEVSIRLNPRKLSAEEVLAVHPDLEPVPWCPDAFYLKERPAFTFDPLLHAGAYYVQEASSMYIAQAIVKSEVFTLHSSVLALDLCAAPGGKSTLLQSLLPEGSLIICNEPVAKRARVLAENIQKWTMGLPEEAPRCIVTRNYPDGFEDFWGCVDILLTDVPCSGEGMFRKDEEARKEWSLENVMMCQERQRRILSDIWHVLKPGGLLIYSTCTFNRYEDEDNARWICDRLGGKLLFERHFLPGRDRGEGFYVAAIQAPDDPLFVEVHSRMFGEKFAPPYDTTNWILGNILYDSMISYPLLPSEGQKELPRIDLSYSEALQYLRHEALRVDAPRGPVTLCYRALPLGLGKGVGTRINNLNPETWRIRTTHTTPFSLLGIDEMKPKGA